MGYLHSGHYSHQVIEKTIDTKDRMLSSKDVKGAKSGLRQFCFVSAHGMPMTGKTRNRKMFSEYRVREIEEGLEGIELEK